MAAKPLLGSHAAPAFVAINPATGPAQVRLGSPVSVVLGPLYGIPDPAAVSPFSTCLTSMTGTRLPLGNPEVARLKASPSIACVQPHRQSDRKSVPRCSRTSSV